jgi:1-acyl-sn-glycerol-3-phosphate acyltransferase
VWIAFGEPIHPSAEMGKAEARAWMERELSRAFCALFDEVRERFALSENDLPQPPARRKGRVES